MQRCPNCRARDPGDRHCRRCGMDLTGLIAVEAATERLIREAVRALVAGDVQAARADLDRARALHHDPLIDLLIAFTTASAVVVSPLEPAAPSTPISMMGR